ncbi:hypothetical protein FQA47_015989 [Oryzias melastigma]|uniref:Uncharacterized protein n=1 Tax=Oryzias melastigma TaxID=30732 RepID=A0A834F3G5_ORYME|nr:hypothetical protein FQA47_015989 [Oryzias melastigma]
MLLQINRMDLADTGEEEEEEEEEERLSGCGSLKFTHPTGAGPPPCLHASRAGQLLDSPAPICTIDRSSSRKPGSTPGFSPAFATSSTSRAHSASTSPPRGRTAALRSPSSPGALRFKWRRLPRRAGRGAAAAAHRHAAALAWSRRYAAALGFCTKNHCILVGGSMRLSWEGVRVRQRVGGITAGKYRSRGAPLQTHALLRQPLRSSGQCAHAAPDLQVGARKSQLCFRRKSS